MRDFGFIHALVFASVIVSTDPIAVVGLFKALGAPKRLAIYRFHEEEHQEAVRRGARERLAKVKDPEGHVPLEQSSSLSDAA